MSQTAAILTALKKGRSLTPLDALGEHGSFRLGARIHELRAEGWPILRDWHVTDTGKRVAKYTLAREGWPE